MQMVSRWFVIAQEGEHKHVRRVVAGWCTESSNVLLDAAVLSAYIMCRALVIGIDKGAGATFCFDPQARCGMKIYLRNAIIANTTRKIRAAPWNVVTGNRSASRGWRPRSGVYDITLKHWRAVMALLSSRATECSPVIEVIGLICALIISYA